VRFIRRELLSWGKDNFADFPWRHSTTHFHSLIAEILLQRTKAEQVVPVYKVFINRFPDCNALASASVKSIEKIILPLGLKWRAKFLSALGKNLAASGGSIPSDILSLEKLPGVGPYAAASFLSLHMNKRAPIIDSNVVRLYGRIFGFETGPETRRDIGIKLLADRITPRRNYRVFSYALIDFTRIICMPRPVHSNCPLFEKCSYCIRNE